MKRLRLFGDGSFPNANDVDTGKVLTVEEYDALTDAQRLRISRVPLTSADIKALVDTAVNLHSRALEHQRDKRWWTALAGGVGGLLGSVLGALLQP